jgi:hypothetical protein
LVQARVRFASIVRDLRIGLAVSDLVSIPTGTRTSAGARPGVVTGPESCVIDRPQSASRAETT